MSLFITSLNSGSNGNCYYIGNDTEAILVDAGISCLETEKRMGRLGLKMSSVKAIFVSHEHTDHIRGIPVLAKKYRVPVYITEITRKKCAMRFDPELILSFKAFVPVEIGGLTVTAFPKPHDACEPHSFIVSGNGIRIGVFTDIGGPCEQLIAHFKQCHAAFLEANYDEEMLDNGKYPFVLKRRIKGGLGHLSNAQALNIFMEHRPVFMTHLFLAHLSKDNNCPELVGNLFRKHACGSQIIVASRFVETPVYQIVAESVAVGVQKSPGSPIHVQLCLF